MTHRFRKKLFGGFVLIFILAGFSIVYYSQGYRVDVSNFSIVKTGAIYIESTPRTSSILLNQKPYKNKSSILRSGTLISTVLPKRYRVTISKEGYEPYEKNIEVLPAQVTRLLNILLIPQTIEPTYDIADIRGDTFIDASLDGRIITQDSEKNKFYLSVLKDPESQTDIGSTISSILGQKIQKILFYPQETSKFIAQTTKGIYRVDFDKKTFTLITKSVFQYTIEGSNLYTISPISATSTQEKLTTIDLALNSVASQKTLSFLAPISSFSIRGNTGIFLLKNGDLIVSNLSKDESIQIAHDAKKAIMSPDAKKIVFQDNDNKLYVYLLEDDIATLNTKKGVSLPVRVMSLAQIDNIWWLGDSYHLIIAYPDKTTIAEITDQEPNNQFILTKKNSALFDVRTDLLYNLTKGELTVESLSF